MSEELNGQSDMMMSDISYFSINSKQQNVRLLTSNIDNEEHLEVSNDFEVTEDDVLVENETAHSNFEEF